MTGRLGDGASMAAASADVNRAIQFLRMDDVSRALSLGLPAPPPPTTATGLRGRGRGPGLGLPTLGPDLRIVSRGFLNAMAIRVIEGRGFDDPSGTRPNRAVLINRTLARSGFLGANPIGRQVYGPGAAPSEVVGILEDVRQFGMDQEPGPQIFVDFAPV